MGTTRGGNSKSKDKLEKGQPGAGLSSLEKEKKPKQDKRFGKRQMTKEELAAWRRKTTRKMKKSAQGTLTNQLPEVLVSVLEEAHEGSCQHAKFLLEVAGPDSLRDARVEKKNRSLTELLLEKLGTVGSRKSGVRRQTLDVGR